MENRLFVCELNKALDKKELDSYFKRYKSGEKELREKLITYNIRLVFYLIRMKYQNYYNQKELISIGFIGLIKAVDTYNLEKSSSFANYALRCINNEIIMYLRKEKKYRFNVSLDAPIKNNNSNNRLFLKDVIRNDEDINNEIFNQELKQEINAYLKKLPDLEQIIINNYFGFNGYKPCNQSSIGLMVGLSQSYVSRIIKKHLLIIKNILIEKDFALEKNVKILLKK